MGGWADWQAGAATVAARSVDHNPTRFEAHRTWNGAVLDTDAAEGKTCFDINQRDDTGRDPRLDLVLDSAALFVGHDRRPIRDQITSGARRSDQRTEEQGAP